MCDSTTVVLYDARVFILPHPPSRTRNTVLLSTGVVPEYGVGGSHQTKNKAAAALISGCTIVLVLVFVLVLRCVICIFL